jgi:hypothetical protein
MCLEERSSGLQVPSTTASGVDFMKHSEEVAQIDQPVAGVVIPT